MSSIIKAVSYYLPEKVLSNEELSQTFEDIDIDKVEKKIGIKQRHISAQDETALDLGYKAAIKLLSEYNIDTNNIDYLIFCTQSPDYFLPSSACILQDKLQLSKSIGAFDYNLGCSGFVYGLSMAKGLIASEQAKSVLLITAETYTKHIHKQDKANRTIFGDAGAACLITENAGENIGKFSLGTDGSGYQKLIVKNGGFRNQQKNSEDYTYGTGNITNDNCLYMNGPDIFNFTIENIPGMIVDTIEKNQLSIGDVDYFIFHQQNSSKNLHFLG